MAKSSKQKESTLRKPKSSTLTPPKTKCSKGKTTLQSKKEGKKPLAAAPVDSDSDEEVADDVPLEEEGEGEESEDDSEDEGVDEEGMERLMRLLGDEGLDDFDRAQLRTLGSEDDSEEQDEEESKGEEISDEAESEEAISEEEKDAANDSDEEVEVASDEEDEEEDEEEAVPLDEAESVDDDAVPRQKLEIDNEVALKRIREAIQLDPSFPWTETLVVSYPEKIEVDVNDDLNREVAFYKQALHGAQAARTLAAKHKFPFTRPSDYFAEMVKTDAHMERIRQRLLDEGAGIKKSEDKRKEREGKKFGKQVQVEKLKEREKSKKEMEDRLNNLKRKRKDILDNAQGNAEDFDVAVEDAISDRPSKKSRGSDRGRGGKPSMPRHTRDSKYGFGGAGRRAKQNTRESTDNFEGRGGGRGGRGGRGRGGRGGGRGGGSGGNRGKTQRPGKSRRQSGRS